MFVEYILKLYILDIGRMASRNIYVNVFGLRSVMNCIKNSWGINVKPQDKLLTFEELKIKKAREWKYVTEEYRIDYSWHLKEKYQGKADSIQLYCAAFQFLQSVYQSLGLLRDICVVLSTEIVYAQVKQAKTIAKIRYCLKVSKYNVQETFTPSVKGLYMILKAGE